MNIQRRMLLLLLKIGGKHMGIGRYIKHSLLPGTIIVDAVKNVIEEDDVVEGIKKSVYQDIVEDNPITSNLIDYVSDKDD